MAAAEDVNGQHEQLELAVWKKTGSKSLADKRELLSFVGFDCAAAAAASGKKLDKWINKKMWEWGKQQLEEEVATSRNSEIGS